jgi:hypothetical protein
MAEANRDSGNLSRVHSNVEVVADVDIVNGGGGGEKLFSLSVSQGEEMYLSNVTRGVISIEIQMIKIKKNKTPGVS